MKFGLSDKQLLEIISKLAEIPDIEEAVFLDRVLLVLIKQHQSLSIILMCDVFKGAPTWIRNNFSEILDCYTSKDPQIVKSSAGS
jgi:hypothetical protein